MAATAAIVAGAAVAAVAVLAACAGAPSAGRAPAAPTITIAHINDTHGRLLPFAVGPGNATAQTGDPGRDPQAFYGSGRVGGYPAMAGLLRRLRERDGADRVLFVHAGDTFSDDLLGNLTRGSATVDVLGAMGLQFLALGNHDFDYGLERTRELQARATFPMRGANIVDASGQPVFGEPFEVFRVGPARVAVLALGYHNTAQTGSRSNVEGLRFSSGVAAARRWVPPLRERADIVVVLSHQGSRVDRELARTVPGIDIIVGGHSHDVIAPPERIGGTWIVQALSDAAMLGELTLTLTAEGRLAALTGRVHTLWADRHSPDPAIAALIESLREPHRHELNAVVATATARIGRRYKSESPFDALVGAILRQHTDAEIAFLPGVGYGVSVGPGPVTREALTTLLPHPVKVATLTLTGRQVVEVLEQSATNLEPADAMDAVGGLVQTSGLHWTLDLARPAGRRITDVRVAGAPIDPDRRYRVVTHQGMLQGLHRYATFAAGRDARVLDDSVSGVVEAALQRRGSVVAPPAAIRIAADADRDADPGGDRR